MTADFHDALTALVDDVEAELGPPRWPVLRTGKRDPIPPLLRKLIYLRDNHRCTRCDIETPNLELDHVVPWSALGEDRATNLRSMCGGCNTARSNYRHIEGKRYQAVTAACDFCLRNHDEPDWAERSWHHGSGMWAGCAACTTVDWWLGDERYRAFCGTCTTVSWVSDKARLL